MSSSTAPNDITPIILAGGIGSRLRSVSKGLPKVLMPALGRPFLTHILDRLLEAGFLHCILSTGYMADTVQEQIGETYGPMRLTYVAEPEPLGTGGGVLHALNSVATKTVMVLNGDTLLGCDYRRFVDKHITGNHSSSMTILQIEDTTRYGTVTVEDGQIRSLKEKQSTGKGWINGGIYFLEYRKLRAMPNGVALSLEEDILPAMIGNETGDGLGAIHSNAPFLDIGTPKSYKKINDFLKINASQFSMQSILQKTIPSISLEKKVEFLSQIISVNYDNEKDHLLKYDIPFEVSEEWRQDYRNVHAHVESNKPAAIEDMNILVAIPARKGSQGLPGKSLKRLNGKPVIAYSIEAALKSKHVNKVLVTTDDPELRKVAIECGAEAPFLRPDCLGGNFISLDHVLIHATTWLEMVEGYWFDMILHLSPTYPLRSAEEIDAAIEQLAASNVRSLVSVSPLPELRGKQVFAPSEAEESLLEPTEHFPDEQIFAQSTYINITYRWMDRPSQNIAFHVAPEKNIDIDTAYELKLCEHMLSEKRTDFSTGAPACLDAEPSPQPSQAEKYSDLMMVINVDSPSAWADWKGCPLVCRWVNAAVAEGAGKIVIAGAGPGTRELSQWAKLPLVDITIPFQDNGLPTPAFLEELEATTNGPVGHICVVNGSGVLTDSNKLAQLFDHYFEAQSPLVTVSSSKTHPYWTKRDEDGQIVSVFEGAHYGQRQLLPERYVEDTMAVITSADSLRSPETRPFGHKWSDDRSIVVNCAFTYAEAHVLHSQDDSTKK